MKKSIFKVFSAIFFLLLFVVLLNGSSRVEKNNKEKTKNIGKIIERHTITKGYIVALSCSLTK